MKTRTAANNMAGKSGARLHPYRNYWYRASVSSPWKSNRILVLKGCLQRWWRLQFHKESHAEDKGLWVVLLGRWHLSIRKKFHVVRKTLTRTTFPGVQSLSLEVSKMQLDRVLNDLIQAPFPLKSGRDYHPSSFPACTVLWFYLQWNSTCLISKDWNRPKDEIKRIKPILSGWTPWLLYWFYG